MLRLIRAWLKAGVLEEGKVTHPLRGSPQGGVISPLLSNVMLHEVDRQWNREEPARKVRLIRYADDMVLLAVTADEAAEAWQRLQAQFKALRLEVNQEKSRLTTADEGFAFLGFEFRRAQQRLLMWPRAKACRQLAERVRRTVRSVPSAATLSTVIQKLNPVLNGWCTYFRVGNSNRVFHATDWMVARRSAALAAPEASLYLAPCQAAMALSVPSPALPTIPHGRESESPGWFAANAYGDWIVGEPDAGKLPVRFDEGVQETCG